jgi:hypothetical protein
LFVAIFTRFNIKTMFTLRSSARIMCTLHSPVEATFSLSSSTRAMCTAVLSFYIVNVMYIYYVYNYVIYLPYPGSSTVALTPSLPLPATSYIITHIIIPHTRIYIYSHIITNFFFFQLFCLYFLNSNLLACIAQPIS